MPSSKRCSTTPTPPSCTSPWAACFGAGATTTAPCAPTSTALALDFLTAGLLDRAEAALLKLEGTTFEREAQLALLGIYERTREWPRATDVARQLQARHGAALETRLAHYLCEQAAALPRPEQAAQAHALLQQARQVAPDAPRPAIDTALFLHRQGQAAEARDLLLHLAAHHPQALPLAAATLVKATQDSGDAAHVRQVLQAAYAHVPALDVMHALAALASTPEHARAHYAAHLAHTPSLIAAQNWLAAESLSDADVAPHVQRALQHAAQPLGRYRCAVCGFESSTHFWQCPGCQTWDSFPALRIEELHTA